MHQKHYLQKEDCVTHERTNCRECMYAIGCLENQQAGREVPYFCRQYGEFAPTQGCHLMGQPGFPTYTAAKYPNPIPELKILSSGGSEQRREPLCENLIFGRELGMRWEKQLFVMAKAECMTCRNCDIGPTCGEFCKRHSVVLYEVPEEYRPGKGE